MKVIIIDSEIHSQLSKLECDLWYKIEFLVRHQDSDLPNVKEYIKEHATPQKMWEIIEEIIAARKNPNYVRGTINLSGNE